MSGERWLLPEGIEEVLPLAAMRLERLRRRLLDLYSSWGYRLVIPPFIEYLESLLTGTGEDLDLQTFKLIDQLTGRLMGVRADMTPQVARIDAHSLRTRAPARLCYLGTVLHTLPDGVSGTRSPVQLGAELYGHAGVESDCEVLCLMLETLDLAGVGQVHLDLGHVGVFRGLARQAGLDAQAEATLHDALQRKAVAEIEVFLDSEVETHDTAGMILALAELNGGAEVLGPARQRLAGAGAESRAALDHLERLADELGRRRPEVAVHFDLAELRGYRYHTGAVFAAFAPGHGQEIARGGRYDDIGHVFGHARPATGFSTDLKTLADLAGDSHQEAGGVLAPWGSDARLLERVAELREAGERVVFELPGQEGRTDELGCDRHLEEVDGHWVTSPLPGADPARG